MRLERTRLRRVARSLLSPGASKDVRFNREDKRFFFDEAFYIENNPGVAGSRLDPFEHFVRIGFAQGLVPVGWFNSEEYLERYEDVAESGIGAFQHFYRHGFLEGRDPSESLHLDDLCSGLARDENFGASGYWTTCKEKVRELSLGDPLLEIIGEYFDSDAYSRDHVFSPELDLSPWQHALMFGQRDFRLFNYLRFPENAWLRREGPVDVSVVVLNWNRNDMTVASLLSLMANTTGYTFEIVLVDNGSEFGHFENLAQFNTHARVIRLSENMFYGEGNNIGVEAARGDVVILLNNDAMVQPGWLEPLVQQLDESDVCTAGPAFFYPDGALQEAGCFLESDGNALLVGRDIEATDEWMSREQVVDYTSGACLALRREEFERSGGFNFVYEPAYYEDSDLCLRLSYSLGKRCVVVPSSKVTHLEHASSEVPIDLGLNHAVARNRRVFLSRWTKEIDGPMTRWVPSERISRGRDKASSLGPVSTSGKPTLHIATPFALTFGGGERYILTLAQFASEAYDVVLVTTRPYSRTRLDLLSDELELDLSSVRLEHLDAAMLNSPDVLVVMDNHVVPRIPGYGKRNIYHCQFPFPMDAVSMGASWPKHRYFDTYVANSEFTKRNLVSAMARVGISRPVDVIFPPVTDQIDATVQADGRSILSIGRFFSSGHQKNFADLIETFGRLSKSHPNLSLTLMGGLPASKEAQDLYQDLLVATEGLNIELFPNATNEQVRTALNRSTFYWHATGLGVNANRSPEACEHFGITPVEAMTAGATVLAVANGGPVEYVRHGETGYLYSDVEELETTMAALLAGELPLIGQRGREEALRFSPAEFWASWEKLIAQEGMHELQGASLLAPQFLQP